MKQKELEYLFMNDYFLLGTKFTKKFLLSRLTIR